MLVRDIGEFQLIDVLAQKIGERAAQGGVEGFRLRLGIGDDAAAWDSPAGASVMTTDTMVEGVHFGLDHIGWPDLGWKAVAVNLSDIAAMGCAPLYSMVTLGLRGDLPVDGVAEMYQGMMDACERFGGEVVGGDVVSSPVFFITVAMLGAAVDTGAGGSSNVRFLTRGSASPGDKIGVTGHLGCSAAGLRMLLRGLSFDKETFGHLRAAHNRPVPRVSAGMLLLREGVTAAIDVSDGLVDDLRKLCKESGVGAVIHSESVPIDDYLRTAYPDESLDLALGGGEDYELLFAAPAHVMNQVTSKCEAPVSVIGEIVEGPEGVRVLAQDGRSIKVDQGGWDHFRK